MFGLNLIPRKVHGGIDYVWSSSLIMAPQIFGFAGDKDASMFCKVMGSSTTAMSLMTRYEWGLIKVLPFNAHLVGDALSVVAGFAGMSALNLSENKKARQALLFFFISEIGAILLTKPDPQ